MKRIITFFAVVSVIGTASQGFAQGGSGGGGSGGGGSGGGSGGGGTGGGTNEYSWNYSHSNYYAWGTNLARMQNEAAPKAYSNQFSHAYAGQAAAGGGGQVQSRFGQKELPTDVQTIVQQFQQDRTKLMSQLKTCSDEQRQQILQDMEQLRSQLREQVHKLREQAQQQAEQMRNRFGNNRDRILDQGAGGEGAGKDR
jgi:vacuolar-type H+-ATPase subunit H